MEGTKMNGSERRNEIYKLISGSDSPLSASYLAGQFSVSRQVIVQDVALIRASGHDIISTNRGYILNQPKKVTRVFEVSHTDEQIGDELNSIVDLGGVVVDVFVWHRVYGKISGNLNIGSRRAVEEFLEGLKSGKSSPLKNVTSNYHYHTIEAPDEKTMDLIMDMLRKKGYLVEREK
jgi:Predicted small molecule binding protein (contains 3H domain)